MTSPAGEAPANTVRLDRGGKSALEIKRSELLELYRTVIDEYRFQVRLNWDRTQYYFVLNSAVFALGITALTAPRVPPRFVAAFLFLLSAVISRLGQQVIATGHDYYRRVIYRKTLIEDLLGRLHRIPGYEHDEAALSLATTAGMAKSREILDRPAEYFAKPLGRHTVLYQTRTILSLYFALSLILLVVTLVPPEIGTLLLHAVTETLP